MKNKNPNPLPTAEQDPPFSISNKEVIDALEEFFLKEDPRIIARTLAAAQVDFHRMAHIEHLSEKEEESILARIALNAAQLDKFVRDVFIEKKEPEYKFAVINMGKDS